MKTLQEQRTEAVLKMQERILELEKENAKAKEIIKELHEGLDKLYLSGLSDKQIAFIERLQVEAEQFISGVEK